MPQVRIRRPVLTTKPPSLDPVPAAMILPAASGALDRECSSSLRSLRPNLIDPPLQRLEPGLHHPGLVAQSQLAEASLQDGLAGGQPMLLMRDLGELGLESSQQRPSGLLRPSHVHPAAGIPYTATAVPAQTLHEVKELRLKPASTR